MIFQWGGPSQLDTWDPKPEAPDAIRGPFAAIQTGFVGSQDAQLAFYMSPAGGGLTLAQAEQLLVQGYHGAVAPFCSVAARAFFANF